jgi:hypothetical protein
MRYHNCVTNEPYSTRLRLDVRTHERLREIVDGHYRSQNAAIVDAINRLWQSLREEQLDTDYAAAVQDNPAYPYESADERAAARARRNARQNASTE